MVNMPGCVGSPSRTTILAPFGKEGGPSFHSISVAGKRAIGLLVWPVAAVGIVNKRRLRAQRGIIGWVRASSASEEDRAPASSSTQGHAQVARARGSQTLP